MAKLLKKKSLQVKAKENVSVTKGTSKNQEVLKEGVPCDLHEKERPHDTNTVGVNIGCTINQGDYQSLRVDCWLTDSVKEDETQEQAFARVIKVIDKVLNETVELYR